MRTTRSVAARVERVAAVCLALLALAACSPDAPNAVAPPSTPHLAVGQQGDLGPALAAQARHTGRLLTDRELLGTAVGRLADGRPAVTLYAKNAAAAARAPRALDGIPVVVEVTGPITALPAVADRPTPSKRPGGGGGGGTVKPTSYLRPAYIGMSTGNANECAAGTIGARVVSGNNVYALSNNHVYARENEASLGETVYQPGRYDLNCRTGTQYQFGTLAKFEKISFSGNNTVDAAIAAVPAGDLQSSTPPGGYGTPSSTPTTAALNMAVQKYGRTTALTTGTVTGINVTIRVQYSTGIATFVDQIEVHGTKGAFSRAGDSGSLIVTRNSASNPVGLLFAGGQNVTFANPIGPVLSALGVSISGK